MCEEYQQVLAKLKRCGRLLSKIEEDLSNALCDLEDLYAGNKPPTGCKPGRKPAVKARSASAKKAGMNGIAPPRVFDLAINPQPNGSAFVRINGGHTIKLAPALVKLLMCLALDLGESPDDLVGWKSFKQVSTFLEMKTRKQYKPHDVSQFIYRLREELEERGGVNRAVIQDNRRYGWRLALVRQHAGPVAPIA